MLVVLVGAWEQELEKSCSTGSCFTWQRRKFNLTHIIGTEHEIYLWHPLVVSLVLWRHISHLGKRCPIVHTAGQIGQGIPGIWVVSGWRVLAL